MAMLVIRAVFVGTSDGELDPPGADFWSEAIGAVKAKHPAFVFVGEVSWDLEYRLQQLGFDYTYDKRQAGRGGCEFASTARHAL
ncbi:MAG: hypothetical protein H0W18_02190 [Acidobacteria bacterium]|nr:hypothetical protein [Acidobacteriota bacterium]